MIRAIVRELPDSLDRCELSHLRRSEINIDLARDQHAQYCRLLQELGADLEQLPVLHQHPDSVFVEDCALILDEAVLITRPGAASRRGETLDVAECMRGYRQEVTTMAPPGTLDGGDVLRLGRKLFVGASARSNAAGIAGLTNWAEGLGYTVQTAALSDCLHLKSAATAIDESTVLLNPDMVDPQVFDGFRTIRVREPAAANILRVGQALVYSECFPKTQALLEQEYDLHLVNNSEILKAEGALTCCSLIFS